MEERTTDVYLDRRPHEESMLGDVLAGLSSSPKRLPSRFFYDETGSKLFDRITNLDEYYLTRTETGILRAYAMEMVACLGPEPILMEFGSGSSIKTRILLDHIQGRATYIPVDISREHLYASAERLKHLYPHLDVLPICADFSREIDTRQIHAREGPLSIFFPGSTLGNLSTEHATALLKQARRMTGEGGGMLIGIDLQKDPEILFAAYDDADGVTAQFNRNILSHINRKLGTSFDPQLFEHTVRYNRDHHRIEMWLTSTTHQEVLVGDSLITFEKGEDILTEYSHKYTLMGFAEMAAKAGYRVARVWTDDREWFSVQYLIAA